LPLKSKHCASSGLPLADKPVFDDERMRFFLYYAGSGKYLAGGAVNNGG